MAANMSGAVFKKTIPTQASLFPPSLGQRRKVSLTSGGITGSVSGEALGNAVRVAHVFGNRYPQREALVYLPDGVTYYTKTH